MKRFTADMDSPIDQESRGTKDVDDGDKAGVEATPTVFIDGQRYNGSLELAAMKPILDAELKKQKK